MKFFVPISRSRAAAEDMLAAIKADCSRMWHYRFSKRRVFALRYRGMQGEALAQVGIPHPPGLEAEMVVCILRTETEFLICTQNRGVVRNKPLRVPRSRVSDVEYFNGVHDAIPA
ncbi:hypothetical protein [Luteolibacter sp. Populi]|uniref:hypothetical protein n=1 Tax=Luteolibacter sp. Populi TaxID=3230487 RepID=UPI003466A7E7